MTLVDYAPRFTEFAAANLARSIFGMEAVARPLPSERDQNFRLRDPEGKGYVLKIANASEKRAALEAQNNILSYLTRTCPNLNWPQVCRTTTGDHIATAVDEHGNSYFVRLLTYIEGQPLARFRPHSLELMQNFGQYLGQMDAALLQFNGILATAPDFQWDLQNAIQVIEQHKSNIVSAERRALVEHFWQNFDRYSAPLLPDLRTSVIHNDANDYNVLVTQDDPHTSKIAGLIDFGDIVYSYTVGELAVACAYAMLDKVEPLRTAAAIVRGYHEALPLTEPEIEVLFGLICMRLCVSVSLSAFQQKQQPDNDYLSISEKPAWALLEQLRDIHPRLAHYTFRQACSLEPCVHTLAVTDWLRQNISMFGSVVEDDLSRSIVLDLSVGSQSFGTLGDMRDSGFLADRIAKALQVAQMETAIGQYNEPRSIYTGTHFAVPGDEGQAQRTIHLGIDLFASEGTDVFAPLSGIVHSFRDNAGHLDYGPTIILEHHIHDELRFYTLFGHLSRTSLEGLYPGKPIGVGERLGEIGGPAVNGHWPPHLHFQIITDLLDREGEFPGVAVPHERDIWLSLCPDPNLILQIDSISSPPSAMRQEDILEARARHIGPSLSISYRKPLHINRGYMQYLYDVTGQAYLDAVNNVAHVGHCHPQVVAAAQQQTAVLNTNTRYLHENLVAYAERLCATLPEELSVCFFVCSGSEANDLALRLARAHTGATDTIVLDGAYHGNLTSLIDISPYKFAGPGGQGKPSHVQIAMMPDPYRGPYREADAGDSYAQHVQKAVQTIKSEGRATAAFIAETLLGCGGQVVLPEGYLNAAFGHVRQAGGVCIADEVQVGFGRVGTHFWGFQTQNVVPDIVTMGKPIGNGHPLAAVVTTPEIAASFANGMEYFNTFGGNPVSCAVGMAVLDVIEQEGLQQRAHDVGGVLMTGLGALKSRFPLIGDVRGAGLFVGMELVRSQETLESAAGEASYIAERMRDHGILISTDGPLHNVLKIKPPLVFAQEDAERLVVTLEKILGETALHMSLPK